MAKQTIGEFLATLRKANGYTQQEVADRLGISNRTLSGWECDKVLPDILLLPALADLYGVTVDDIIAGERKVRENVVLTSKAEIGLYKSKLTKFTTQSWILLGVIILGMISLFFGIIGMYATIAKIFLSIGIACLVVCIFVLFALWNGTDCIVDETSALGRSFCILRRSKLCHILCVISLLFFVFGLFWTALIFAEYTYHIEYDTSVSTWYDGKLIRPVLEFSLEFNPTRIAFTLIPLSIPLILFFVGNIMHKKALVKWGNEDTRLRMLANRNYNFAVALWGLIPFAAAVAIAVGYTLYKYFHYEYEPYGAWAGVLIIGIDVIVCVALCMRRQFRCDPKLS